MTALAVAPPPPVADDETIVVGPGPRNARTDPQTGLRFYQWQGRDLPSATTIRRLAGLPHGLHHWALSRVIARAVGQIDELQRMLTRERRPRERVLEKNRQAEASKWLRAAATEERDAAAELGLAVHDAAAAGLDVDSVEPAARPRLRQFRHWLAEARPDILGSEFQVFNPTVGYAGTIDMLCRFPNGQVWLVDIKTGKGVYPEHLLQVLYYANADLAGADDVVDLRLTGLLKQAAGVAVLHLADDHWEFDVLRRDPADWQAAIGLLQFARWAHEHPTIDTLTVAQRRGSAPGSVL